MIASREDWDSFERSLRRGMGLRNFTAGLIVLLALGGAAAAFVKRDEIGKALRTQTVRATEQEPNGTSGDVFNPKGSGAGPRVPDRLHGRTHLRLLSEAPAGRARHVERLGQLDG